MRSFPFILFAEVLLALVLVSTTCSAQSGRPRFESSYQLVLLDKDSPGEAECNAVGDLPLTYQWYSDSFYQNGDEIGSQMNTSIYSQQSPNGSLLIFDNIQPYDAGLYTCTATNIHGLESKVYDIVVANTSGNNTGNETVTIDQVDVINVTENSIQFQVRTSEDLRELIIEYKEKVDDLAKTKKFQGFLSGDKPIIDGLVPSGRYSIRFQAMSYQGVLSQWSKSYEVVLFPGVPEVIYRNFNDGTLQIEWFRRFDDFRRETIDEYSLSYNTMQMQSGNSWISSKCIINVQIPSPCFGPRHTITGLSKNAYYEIRLKARTSTGYGKPHLTKVFVT